MAAGASLRSSLQLNSDEEYMEKHTANTVVSSSDSYDTLASFTQVIIHQSLSELRQSSHLIKYNQGCYNASTKFEG